MNWRLRLWRANGLDAPILVDTIHAPIDCTITSGSGSELNTLTVRTAGPSLLHEYGIAAAWEYLDEATGTWIEPRGCRFVARTRGRDQVAPDDPEKTVLVELPWLLHHGLIYPDPAPVSSTPTGKRRFVSGDPATWVSRLINEARARGACTAVPHRIAGPPNNLSGADIDVSLWQSILVGIEDWLSRGMISIRATGSVLTIANGTYFAVDRSSLTIRATPGDVQSAPVTETYFTAPTNLVAFYGGDTSQPHFLGRDEMPVLPWGRIEDSGSYSSSIASAAPLESPMATEHVAAELAGTDGALPFRDFYVGDTLTVFDAPRVITEASLSIDASGSVTGHVATGTLPLDPIDALFRRIR